MPTPTAAEPVITIYTKRLWSDSWTEQPLATAVSITSAAAPSHSSAVIRWRYGWGQLPAIGSRPKDVSPKIIDRGNLINKYVWIRVVTVDASRNWFGFIPDVDDQRSAIIENAPTGIETYTAYGLTWFLENSRPIMQSVVMVNGAETRINMALPFNGGTDGKRRGNRVSSDNMDPDRIVFTDRVTSDTVAPWTAEHAIGYLIKYFRPKSPSGNQAINFALKAGCEAYLRYEIPFTAYHGVTLWQAINMLIDRRRGLIWDAVVNDTAGQVEIRVTSSADASITLEDGSVIPANGRKMSYDFDSAVNILSAVTTKSLAVKFDQVICEGERAGAVGTLRPQTNIDADWESADVTTYNAGASGQTGYSSLTDTEKEAANQDARARDEIERVFSWWRVPIDWNGLADTDPSTGSGAKFFQKLDDEGEQKPADTAATFHPAGLRIQPYLPMRSGVDYSGTVTPETHGADIRDADFIPPIVLFQVAPINTQSGSPDDGWVHAERLNQATDSGLAARQFNYSIDVRVRRDAPGLIFSTAGAPQHYIAQDLFVANGAFEDIPSGEGIDSDSWLATVYMLQDDFARGVYPKNVFIPDWDYLRVLRIKVPEAYFDTLVAGTIVGVDAGELKISSGGTLRDDRKRLKNIARLAFEWYGKTRKTLSLSFREVISDFDIGQLITTIGSGDHEEEINTCVTQITFDLVRCTTSVRTQFAELDFAGSTL